MATIILTGSCGTNATYNLYDDGLLEILGTGEIKQYSKTTYPWHSKKSTISTITIADGITYIPLYAFENCTNLKSVSIGSGVTEIDAFSFGDCTSLTSITLPTGLSMLSGNIFYGCSSLTRVVIKNKASVISFLGTSPFSNTPIANLKGTIIVPPSLLTQYRTNEKWSEYSSIIFEYASLTELFKGVADSIRKKTGSTDNIVAYSFPAEIESIKTGVDGYDLWNSKKVTVSQGVIPAYAFNENTVLQTIDMHEGVTNIGDYAFRNCSSLQGITIPNSVTNIGGQAFQGCTSLQNLTIGNEVTNIPSGAFQGCTNLKEVTIPDTVERIQTSAFANCENLQTVVIGEGVTTIENGVFENCPYIYTVKLGSYVSKVESLAFNGCYIDSLYLYYNGVVTVDADFLGTADIMTVYVPTDYLDAYFENETWGMFSIEAIPE